MDIIKSPIFLKINISIHVTQYSIKSYIYIISCLSEHNCGDTVHFSLSDGKCLNHCVSKLSKKTPPKQLLRTIYVSIIIIVMQNHNNLIRNCINIYSLFFLFTLKMLIL